MPRWAGLRRVGACAGAASRRVWPHRACYEGAGGSCSGPGPDRDRVRVRAGPFVSGPMAHPWCGVRVQVRADGGRAEREEPFHNLSALCGLVLIGVADPVSEPEGAVGVEEPMRVLKVHVVAGRPRWAVSALQVQDFLGDSSGDSGGEPALAGGDARKTLDVSAAGLHHPA